MSLCLIYPTIKAILSLCTEVFVTSVETTLCPQTWQENFWGLGCHLIVAANTRKWKYLMKCIHWFHEEAEVDRTIKIQHWTLMRIPLHSQSYYGLYFPSPISSCEAKRSTTLKSHSVLVLFIGVQCHGMHFCCLCSNRKQTVAEYTIQNLGENLCE